MISFKNITNVSFTILLTLIGFGKNDYPVNIQSENGVSVPSYHLSESGATPLPSTGDILGFYTDINAANPKQIDIVSFANKNGLPTSIVNTGQAVNVSPINGLFPSNHSAFDFANRDLVCLITGEEFMLTYDDQGCLIGPVVNLAPLSPAAPQYFNNSLYGILVENNGNGSGPDVDFEIVNNIQTGIVDGVIPWNFTPSPGYTFRHEFMSSATNGVDELYFVSGANLIIYTDPVPPGSNPVIPIDLDPSNQFFYYGIEYKSPDILWALKANAIAQTLELVEIDIKNNTSPPPMTTLYDLQANVLPGPDGTILNVDNYSTTLDTCQMKYYFSTVYDHTNSSSRLIEIDVLKISHMQQINPLYLFGIEIKSLSCENCTAEFNFTSIDSCGNVQFNSNAAGIGNFTYTWDFGDPASGANNTSTLANPSHDYTACGMYNVSLTVECPDGTIWTVIQTVTISDAIPPNIVCPPHLNLKCDDDLSPAFTGTATATDNCLIIQPLTYSDDTLFMIPCDGLVERTWTATDWCGNTSSCIQNIVVRDNVPPILLNCPPSMTIYGTLDSLGVCTANAIIISPTGTDNCSAGVLVSNNINGTGDPSGVFTSGSTTITWTALDSCMNTSVCSTIITVLCDSCMCVGFDSLQFYMTGGLNLPGFNLPVTCGNMPPVTLPCIGSDALYQFNGNFQCTDSCAAQVNYEIMSLDNGSSSSGSLITYPTGGNNFHFEFPWIKPPPGNYQMILTGNCTGDTCMCIVNFIVPPCIDCECGSYTDINYIPIQGAPNQNAVCGDTLIAQCNGSFPWTLIGNFLCAGTDCPDSTQMSWILTHPDGSVIVDSTVASPGFNVLIQGTSFDTSGLYQLSIQAICGLDTCVCDFVIEVACDEDPCCTDFDDFCERIENAVTITLDNDSCKVKLTIDSLGCNDYLEYIDWGDSTIDTLQLPSGDMAMHVYSTSGTFVISYLVIELGDNNDTCFQKIMIDTINIVCKTCSCGGFDMYARGGVYSGHTPVSCGSQNPYIMGCAMAGGSYIYGFFNCVGSECSNNNGIEFEILEMPSGMLVTKGVVNSSPNYYNGYFIINLFPHLSLSGDYDIKFTGQCGLDTCTCIIKFQVNCPNSCLCDELIQDVALGFFAGGTNAACMRTFVPLSLCLNDSVNWTVNNISSLIAFGNSRFDYTFPSSGTYDVCMDVVRTEPISGKQCNEKYCRKVYVRCGNSPEISLIDCDPNEIRNGDFTKNAISGPLGLSGEIDDWHLFPNEGEGLVFVDESIGSSDSGQVLLQGNKNNFAGIWQELDLREDTFVNIAFEYINMRDDLLPIGTVLEFRLQESPELGSPAQVLLSVPLDRTNIAEWGYQEVRVAAKKGPDPEKRFLVICLQNSSETETSVIGIDNIELCTSDFGVSTAETRKESIDFFPNPTMGELTIRFRDGLQRNSKIQIHDLLGRVVQSESLSYDIKEHSFSFTGHAAGVYFIKVVNDKGIHVWTEKIIKQ